MQIMDKDNLGSAVNLPSVAGKFLENRMQFLMMHVGFEKWVMEGSS